MILPLEEVEDLQHARDVQIRPLHPRLMRPMAVAYRNLPVLDPAVSSVLKVLEEFAG
ncbi:hypothetical protein [Diaphorobacter aerolatus]|uniref:hypothetical protein n=1 Tax=Diaphorobacter aerolatus TaxID=1288495 RepID=UPI001D00B3CA|nr:hypothetical protein [Diaphorobacter aerolatus]